MANEKTKKNNIFKAYFTPFGIKQVCDILMFVSAVIIIIGVFTLIDAMTLIGLIVFLAADLVTLVRHILVLTSKINRRSPDYKAALLGTILTGIMLVLAIVGIIAFFVV